MRTIDPGQKYSHWNGAGLPLPRCMRSRNAGAKLILFIAAI